MTDPDETPEADGSDDAVPEGSPGAGDTAGSSSTADADGSPPPDEPLESIDDLDVDADVDTDADLGPEELERAFSVLEEATTTDALEGSQLDRLLGILERAVSSPAETDARTVAELLAVVEEVLLDPGGLESVELDGVLDVLEESLAGATASDPEDVHDVFEVLEAGITDPSALQPEDVERFRAGLERTIVDLTEPGGGGLGRLFSIPGVADRDPDATDLEEGEFLDPFRLARVATALTQRATGYSVESGIRTGTRMAYAAATAESPAALLTATRAIALDELRLAGVDIGAERTDWLEAHREAVGDRRPVTAETLRERGAELLSKSAEVGREEAIHPAFSGILESLAADEARILRLLATEGEKPYMDVRSKSYVPFRSHPVAEHLTKIGADSGCRRTDRTPIYLQNLERLGLIAFREEPIDDLKVYQVLEAQPHIEAARAAADRPTTTYGRVELTDLGAEFCRVCLPVAVDVDTPRTRFRRESE